MLAEQGPIDSYKEDTADARVLVGQGDSGDLVAVSDQLQSFLEKQAEEEINSKPTL